MSKYEGFEWEKCHGAWISTEVAKQMGYQIDNGARIFREDDTAAHLQYGVTFNPVQEWDDVYPVMWRLMKMTGGIEMREDGSVITQIGSEKATAFGGHCRAICILFLMAKDAEKELQNS